VSLRELAAQIDRAGEVLTAAGTGLADLAPPAGGFGATAPGRLGELGRDLHAQAVAALAARSREAAAHGARLSDTAQLLRWVGANYAEAEDAARERFVGGPT
jgi:hypothetical protein